MMAEERVTVAVGIELSTTPTATRCATIAAFRSSTCGFFQLPAQSIQSIQSIQGATAVLNQQVCSIGEMLQIVTFDVFDAQAGDAIEQIARGFDSVSGGFEEIRDFGFGVDVQSRADAEIALQGMILSH